MTGSITIFLYEPFPLENGITLFNFQGKAEYSQLIFRLNKLKKHDTLIDDTIELCIFTLILTSHLMNH